MTAEKNIEEMRLAAMIATSETMIGFCEGGFPITGDTCQFCGATWKDKCCRADRAKHSSGQPRD